ncbi:MAG: MATE family efflux transporter [Succinivibrio sp.]|nr:MATE family efflux transporter [Succinivibrio sp.]
MRELRDSLDFEHMEISRLFLKLFFPTFLGLLFIASLNIADGIFVGQGIGADALAAVNIAAPIYFIIMGMSILFGTGVSIVATIYLARGNVKAANLNVTQALYCPFLLMFLVSFMLYFKPDTLNYLFGGNSQLEPLVVEYLTYLTPLPPLMSVAVVGLFVIRFDGAPNYAMYVNILPSLCNIGLDYLFIFPWGLGLKGAALATVISEVLAFSMVAFYFVFLHKSVALYRVRLSLTVLRLTARNLGYMVKLGFPSLVAELALTFMMITGNYMFVRWLQEAGVAAFSVACYLFPLVFMCCNAIFQAALPIESYNLGKKDYAKILLTFRLSLKWTVVTGLMQTALCIFATDLLLRLFLEEHSRAYQLALAGFPYFALSFIFFSLNIVIIGFYQSMGRSALALLFMGLRGLFLVVPVFILLPELIGIPGLWLAVPLSELLTLSLILMRLRLDLKRLGSLT